MIAHKYLKSARDACLALFYPLECRLCGSSVDSQDDGATCSLCWQKTRIFNSIEKLCNKCGRLLENVDRNFSSETILFCHACENDFYSTARAVGVYEGALRVAVLELKEKPFVPFRLKNLLYQTLNRSAAFARATKIVPVPLHPKREKTRGFNQATVLARLLSEQNKLTVLENCLVRELFTRQHRVGMDEKARFESVNKAFAIKQPRLIENENILLVDDVFTSGATVSVCAKTLLEAGAQTVSVLTIARAI